MQHFEIGVRVLANVLFHKNTRGSRAVVKLGIDISEEQDNVFTREQERKILVKKCFQKTILYR